MVKALEELGNSVYKFDYRINQIKAKGIYKYLDKLLSFCRRFPIIGKYSIKIYTSILHRKKIAQDLNNQSTIINPDLIWLCKTDTLDISKLRYFKNKICYYFMDPISVARKIRVDLITQNCNFGIATFSFVAKNFLNSSFIRNNIQGVDSSKFNVRKKYKLRKNKIVFVSNKTPKRNKIVKQIRELGISIDCYGDGWENKAIYSHELNDLYNQYKFALNICQDKYGFSVRVQQALSSGCILISESCIDLMNYSKLNKNIHLFRNLKELLKLWNKREEINYLDNQFSFDWKEILKDDLDWIRNKIK